MSQSGHSGYGSILSQRVAGLYWHGKGAGPVATGRTVIVEVKGAKDGDSHLQLSTAEAAEAVADDARGRAQRAPECRKARKGDCSMSWQEHHVLPAGFGRRGGSS